MAAYTFGMTHLQKFSEPPRRPRYDWQRIAEAAIADPDKWVLVPDDAPFMKAPLVRYGYLTAFPAGAFDGVQRDKRLYIQFVGWPLDPDYRHAKGTDAAAYREIPRHPVTVTKRPNQLKPEDIPNGDTKVTLRGMPYTVGEIVATLRNHRGEPRLLEEGKKKTLAALEADLRALLPKDITYAFRADPDHPKRGSLYAMVKAVES